MKQWNTLKVIYIRIICYRFQTDYRTDALLHAPVLLGKKSGVTKNPLRNRVVKESSAMICLGQTKSRFHRNIQVRTWSLLGRLWPAKDQIPSVFGCSAEGSADVGEGGTPTSPSSLLRKGTAKLVIQAYLWSVWWINTALEHRQKTVCYWKSAFWGWQYMLDIIHVLYP